MTDFPVYDQYHLPQTERSKRTYLDRISNWEKQGRLLVMRVGQIRAVRAEQYDKLLREDHEIKRTFCPTCGQKRVAHE